MSEQRPAPEGEPISVDVLKLSRDELPEAESLPLAVAAALSRFQDMLTMVYPNPPAPMLEWHMADCTYVVTYASQAQLPLVADLMIEKAGKPERVISMGDAKRRHIQPDGMVAALDCIAACGVDPDGALWTGTCDWWPPLAIDGTPIFADDRPSAAGGAGKVAAVLKLIMELGHQEN